MTRKWTPTAPARDGAVEAWIATKIDPADTSTSSFVDWRAMGFQSWGELKAWAHRNGIDDARRLASLAREFREQIKHESEPGPVSQRRARRARLTPRSAPLPQGELVCRLWPFWVQTSEIAAFLGVGTRRVRRWLYRERIYKKIGGRVVVTPHDLGRADPDNFGFLRARLAKIDRAIEKATDSVDLGTSAPRTSPPPDFAWRDWPRIYTHEIVDLLNQRGATNRWDARRIRRRLGAAKVMFPWSRFQVTTAALLRERAPEIWRELLPHFQTAEPDFDSVGQNAT